MADILERQQLDQSNCKRTVRTYSEEARAKIGKYASINGTASARRHFIKERGDLPESTVHKYKQLYEKEVSARAKSDDFSDITSLPPKNRGRPLALGESLDTQIQKTSVGRHASQLQPSSGSS